MSCNDHRRFVLERGFASMGSSGEDGHGDGVVDPRSGFCAASGIYYSKRPCVELPRECLCSFPSVVLESGDYGSVIAYVDGSSGQAVTYRQLRENVESVACGLAAFGVRQGDVVLILSRNFLHFSAVVLGVLRLGAVVTTANPANSSKEVARQIKDSGAKFVTTTPDLLQKLHGFGLPLILIQDDGHAAAKASATARCTTVSKLLQFGPVGIPNVRIRQEDTAALLYSSGTTGTSKGVILTHRNLIARHCMFVNRDNGKPWIGRIYLALVPMYHVYGLNWFAGGLLSKGCTIVIMAKYSMKEMLTLIQRYKVTHLPLVPPIVVDLCKSELVNKYDLSSLEHIICGAAPLNSKDERSFHNRFPTISIAQGYGLTESTGTGAYAEGECTYYGSTGLIAPNMEAKVVDVDSGTCLPPNNQGELWLRGPSIMKGYFGNPGATAATVNLEGWLCTGDLAYINEEGYLHVVDRLKELIKYKGLQVAPAELEAVLLSHPEIVDAAVIPCPDEAAGQIPMAFVIRCPESTLREVDVINFVADHVAHYKRVRRVAFVSSIPKSSSGKILRRQLAMQLNAKL